VLARFGTPEQKKKYLAPLLRGDIRSSFSMTEYGGECESHRRTSL
jgi:acyl-CoA dehydrogenase